MQSKSQETEIKANKPLRICLLTYRGNPRCGGQGVYAKRLSRALADLGHKVDVVSGPPYPELDPDITLHKLPSLDLYNPEALFRVPTLRELKDPINVLEWASVSAGGFPEPLTFALRARKFLHDNRDNYDVVHDNQTLAFGMLDIQDMIPLVTTIHHPITVDKQTELDAAPHIFARLRVHRWYAFLNMQTKVSQKLRNLVTVSQASRKDISEAFDVPEERFRIAHNGVNFEVFYPLEGMERQKNLIICTNSADTPLKGLRYLIEAVDRIRQYRDIHLLVIGKPKEDGVIENLVKKLKIADNITFTGRIEDEEFAGYYASATMAVVPSLYEGFGMPASEAMACRVPVISTTGGALPEVVGDTGLLVPPADTDALEKAIVRLLDDPAERERLAQAGYERALECFTWRNTALQMEEAYREALAC